MKVIITGTSGFIGSEVLNQCIANPAITTIKSSPVQDFHIYTDALLQKLENVDAYIWCLGTTAAIPEIEIDYPVAFARAMTPRLKKRLRYLHLSGVLAVQNQEMKLLFLQQGRRTKERAEMGMVGFETGKGGSSWWRNFVVKPAMVLKVEEGWLKSISASLVASVRVDILAGAMIDIVVNGGKQRILDNGAIVLRGGSSPGRS